LGVIDWIIGYAGYAMGVGIFITAIATFAIHMKQDRLNIKHARYEQEIKNKLDNANEQIIRAQNKAIESRDEIIKNLTGLVTGGDSAFYLEPHVVDYRDGKLKLMLKQQFTGKYPMYDVSIKIDQYSYLKNKGSKPGGEWVLSHTENAEHIGNVNPLDSMKYRKLIPIPSKDKANTGFGIKFCVLISARNGSLEEEIYLRLTNDHRIAYRVTRTTPNYNQEHGMSVPFNIDLGVVRHVDKGFPTGDLNYLNAKPGWKKDEFEKSTGVDL
jgi:hypothetical protein